MNALARITPAGIQLPAPPQLLYSKGTLARLLDCCTRTIERKVAIGEFPPPDIADGNFIRWKHETILRWIAQQSRDTLSRGG